MLLDGAGVEVEDVGDHAHLPPRVAERLADICRLETGETVGVLLDERRHPAQQASAVGRLNRAPGGIRSPRGGDGAIGLLDSRALQRRDRFLGRRVEDLERRHPRSYSLSRS